MDGWSLGSRYKDSTVTCSCRPGNVLLIRRFSDRHSVCRAPSDSDTLLAGSAKFRGAQAPQSSEDGEVAEGQMELRIRAWHCGCQGSVIFLFLIIEL